MKFKPYLKPQYTLVSCLDSIALLRRNLKDLLDRKDWDRKVFVERDTRVASGLTDFPNHAILDRGRLVGLWEFDGERGDIAWASFGLKDKALDAAVAETEKYVKEQLGDARTFSLDSIKSRAPLIAALRKAK